MTLRDAWDRQADEWARFVRTPDADRTNERFNLPRLLDLLPPPGRATLDLGCGEGRLGRELVRLGHRVGGVESSPRMVEVASECPEAVFADDEGSGGTDVIARDLLLRVIHGLPEGDRLLLTLVFGEHLSYSEVARRLGITEGAVKTRMCRCKDRIVQRGRDLMK